jgi:hypothetical protein
MAAPRRKTGKLNLTDMRNKRAAALGGENVELEGDDGEILCTIPRMAFWDAAAYADVVTGDDDEEDGRLSDMRTLQRVMDPVEYEKLEALDLTLGDLKETVAEVMREAKSPEQRRSSTR